MPHNSCLFRALNGPREAAPEASAILQGSIEGPLSGAVRGVPRTDGPATASTALQSSRLGETGRAVWTA